MRAHEGFVRAAAEMMDVSQECGRNGTACAGCSQSSCRSVCMRRLRGAPCQWITSNRSSHPLPRQAVFPPCHPFPAQTTTDDSSRHLSLAVAGTGIVLCQFGLDSPLEPLPKGKLDPTHHPQPPGSTKLPYLTNCLLWVEC